jgi:hypothetical protein
LPPSVELTASRSFQIGAELATNSLVERSVLAPPDRSLFGRWVALGIQRAKPKCEERFGAFLVGG